MAHRIASLILLFAAVCRATVNLTEQQLRVCQGHDAILANCSTVGTGGLVWLFSGQADVRFQPSTIPTLGTTLERMNQGSNGSVFTFTLDDFDNETDTYRSTANVSNIQLSDNATSITCSEPTPQNPISIVVIVLEVCPSPSSTIATITSTIVIIPDRSTTSPSVVSSPSVSVSSPSVSVSSPTVSVSVPMVMGGLNLVIPIVLTLLVLVLLVLLVVIVAVVVLVLLIRNKKGRFADSLEVYYDCPEPEDQDVESQKLQQSLSPPPTTLPPAPATAPPFIECNEVKTAHDGILYSMDVLDNNEGVP